MLSKKYFSIAEVSKISHLPAYRLRYIEKSDPNITIVQIRGRRYYTKSNIDYLTQHYAIEVSETVANIITKIDILLSKFRQLAASCL